MVKAKNRQGGKPFSALLQLIEEEAARFAAELVPIAGKPGNAPQALLVIDGTLSPARKGELAQATAAAGSPPATGIVPQSGLAEGVSVLGAESFLGCVRSALARVKKSRLPCSLLLVNIDDRGLLGPAAAAIEMAMEGDHHLAHVDHTTLALLLPGLTRNRALRQAAAIHQSLSAVTPGRVIIGLAVCMARAVPGAEEFMAMARNELTKAEHEADDIFYSFPNQDDDSCQVTAEERAQLFRFLKHG